jgi:hypothetical protein
MLVHQEQSGRHLRNKWNIRFFRFKLEQVVIRFFRYKWNFRFIRNKWNCRPSGTSGSSGTSRTAWHIGYIRFKWY